MSSPETSPASCLRGSSMAASSETTLDEGLHALVLALERGLGHRVPKHAGGDRVALVVVGVQEALGAGPLDDLGQLPTEVHRVLDAQAESLPARRVMDVSGVAGQQYPAGAIGGGLAGHVGEPGDPRGVVDPEVCAEYRRSAPH